MNSSQENAEAKAAKIARSIYRLTLAGHAFMEAKSLAIHTLKQRLEPGSDLYRAMVTGICTCYSRPFMEASGVGKLPPDFENFDAAPGNGSLRKTHTTLLETRHKLAAHHDLDHLQARFNEGMIPLGPGELKIQFAKDTTYSIQLQHPFVLPGAIEGVPELVDFQISRLRTALDNQMTTFTRTGETPQDVVIRLKQDKPTAA